MQGLLAQDLTSLNLFKSSFPSTDLEIVLVSGVLVGILTLLVLAILIASAYKPKRKQRDWSKEEEPAKVGEVYVETVDDDSDENREEVESVSTEEPWKEHSIGETMAVSEDNEEIANEIEKAGEGKTQVTKKDEKNCKSIKRMRKYRKTRLEKLEKKQFKQGLSRKEEIKKKMYQEELDVLQKEILENPAFLKELGEKANWAFEEAKKGTPSNEIRKKLVEDDYTKKEIDLIREAFKIKKRKME